MKKPHVIHGLSPCMRKILKIMKLTVILVLLVNINLFASKAYSQTTRLSFKVNNMSLENVLNKIEQQSEFHFFYAGDINVNKKISGNFKNKKITTILNEVKGQAGVNYEFRGKQIILSPENKVADRISAQAPKNISGVIKDDTGATLPGVSVVIKGTTTGTITDINGKYTLTNVKLTDILVFSFVGMKAQEITVGNKNNISITMKASAIGLDEVVAIGYGTTTKRKNVGAMTTMKSESLKETPFNNVTDAMQGYVAGVIVNSEGGAPGSVPTISIRGGGKPLYVIDGVMIDKDDDFSFASLNPNDIESMSFLKDAAATAVYGSRAGNGIVLITTKRGTKGAPKVNYSYNLQLSEPTVVPKQINTYQFYKMATDAAQFDGTASKYSHQDLLDAKNGKVVSTDWPSLGLKDFSVDHRHNLSLSGGDDITKYFVSLGYIDQKGILKSGASNLQRYNIRGSVNSNLKKIGLNVGLTINSSIQKVREPSIGYKRGMSMLIAYFPYNPAYNSIGQYSAKGNDNPLALEDMNAGYIKKEDSFTNTQLNLKWTVPNIKGLTVGSSTTYKRGFIQDREWDASVPTYFEPSENREPRSNVIPRLDIKHYNTNKIDFGVNVNYARTFGKHNVQLTGVYNEIYRTQEYLQAGRANYLVNYLDQIRVGPSGMKSNDGNKYESASKGYVGRVKYDFASRYVFEFNFRYDGNDNFAKGHKWGFFPSVSTAWIISDESFMKSLDDKNILNLLKLRLSTGKTGITEGVNRFGYLSVYNVTPDTYDIGGQSKLGYSEGDLVNPAQLTWYTRNSKNIGIDFASLHNKLEGTFDYFYYRTSGYLVSPSVDYTETLGKEFPQIKSNSAQRREGFEVSLNYKQKFHDFSFNVGANYAYYNQLWEHKDDESLVNLKNPYVRQTNQTDNFGSLYQNAGLYQNSNQILNHARPLLFSSARPGDLSYVDANGDGKIDESDMRRCGMPTFPHSTYGVDFGANFKGWFLKGLIQGTGDRYMPLGIGMMESGFMAKITTASLDYWTPSNTHPKFARVSGSGLSSANNAMQSDYDIVNARYVRLKILQVGYNLKFRALANTSWIKSCKVFVSGTNLLTFSKTMNYDFDPESVTGNLTTKKSFAGRLGYPVQRTYQLGVNIGF